MKTYNNLWEQFISKENFALALHDSQLGKKKQKQVIEFNKNPEVNLENIRQDVINGRFHTSEYKSMIIFEPKKRVIYKLPYNPDRIVQHAIMNVLPFNLQKQKVASIKYSLLAQMLLLTCLKNMNQNYLLLLP